MAGETIITIVGNVTRDPEVRQAGNAQVASFAVAVNERKFDRQSNEWKDGPATFYDVAAWRELGANVAASIRKGMPVIVQGAFRSRSYTDKDNNQRVAWELEASAVGPNLTHSTAVVTRAQAGGQGQPQQAPGAGVPGMVPSMPGAPQQVQGYPTPQGYPAPGGGYQAPVGPPQQAPAQPQPQTWGPPAQYGDDTPF